MIQLCSEGSWVSQLVQICYLIFLVATTVVAVATAILVPRAMFFIMREIYRSNKNREEKNKCR